MQRLKPRSPFKLVRNRGLANGLALGWAFYEGGGGKVYDLNNSGYIGTFDGNWTAGRSGWAAHTDGASTQIVLTRTSGQISPNIQVGDFTIAVRFTVSALGSYTPVFDSYDSVSAGRNYSLFVNAGGGAAFVYYNVGSGAGTDGIGIGTTIAVNTWYDLVVTRKGTLSSFYINGKLGGTDSTQTGTTSNTTSTRTLSLGGNPSGGGTKEPTTYDYFALWSRALTAGEVAQLYYDPFAIYRPRSRYLVGVAGGATSYLFPSRSWVWDHQAPSLGFANAATAKSWVWSPRSPTINTAIAAAQRAWAWNHQAPLVTLTIAGVQKAWAWVGRAPTLAQTTIAAAQKAWQWVARGPTIPGILQNIKQYLYWVVGW